MPMPTHSEISRALLEALEDGKPHALEDLRAYVIRRFNITEKELAEKNSHGRPLLLERMSRASRPLLAERLTRASRPLLLERMSRAMYLLKDAGMIVKPQYAAYAITQKGLDALAENSDKPFTEDVNADFYDVDDNDNGDAEIHEELELKDEAKDKAEGEINGELNEEINVKSETDITPEAESVPEPEVASEIQAENEAEIEPETAAEINFETEQDLTPEITPEEAEVLFDSGSDTEPEAPETEIQNVETENTGEIENTEAENNEVESYEVESNEDGITIEGSEEEDVKAEAEVAAEIQDGELEVLEGGEFEPDVEPEIQFEEEDIEKNLDENTDEVNEINNELNETAETSDETEEAEVEENKIEENEVEKNEKDDDEKEVEENIDAGSQEADDINSSELGRELVMELSSVFEQFNETMTFEILDNVYRLSDAAFEQFVMDLLSKMGYRSFQNARYTSMSGESEIHGLIIDEKQASSPIYIHATRQNPADVIDDVEIEKFAETVEGKGGRGLFVTTAKFSQNAEKFAEERDMLLIDGYKLARLMMAHNFCVRLKDAFEVKAFDADAFRDYED